MKKLPPFFSTLRHPGTCLFLGILVGIAHYSLAQTSDWPFPSHNQSPAPNASQSAGTFSSSNSTSPGSPAVTARDPKSIPGGYPASVWNDVQAEAAKNPNSNEARAVEMRSTIKAYYATYAKWTPPAPSQPANGKLRNLADPPKAPRFTITDKVWPARAGDGSICLWADDKLAAMSLGIDDNQAMDVGYWKELSKKYGGLNITWNLITYDIGGGVDKGHLALYGTWPFWQQLLDEGYHIASHSMMHCTDPVPEDGWPGPDWEASESIRLLDTHLKGQKTRVFVYPGSGVKGFGIPGGYTPNSSWRPALVRYFAAARGGGGEAVNEANMIDYFNIHSTTGSVPNLLDDPKHPELNLNNLFNPDPKSPYHKQYRGWATIFIHFIGAGKDFDTNPFTIAYGKVLAFYNDHRADLWTGFFDDVALYGEERDTATLKTTEAGSNRILLELTDKMDPEMFDYPLTVKVRLGDSWKGTQATQNGKAIPCQILTHEGATYALVKAVPDRGEIAIVPASAPNGPQ